jgi:uncharacterized DUF497 family protein
MRERPLLNLRKHSLTFVEAASVFLDPLYATECHPPDDWWSLPMQEQDDTIRIISARKATGAERKLYEEG